jgi:hypothetical protein
MRKYLQEKYMMCIPVSQADYDLAGLSLGQLVQRVNTVSLSVLSHVSFTYKSEARSMNGHRYRETAYSPSQG